MKSYFLLKRPLWDSLGSYSKDEGDQVSAKRTAESQRKRTWNVQKLKMYHSPWSDKQEKSPETPEESVKRQTMNLPTRNFYYRLAGQNGKLRSALKQAKVHTAKRPIWNSEPRSSWEARSLEVVGKPESNPEQSEEPSGAVSPWKHPIWRSSLGIVYPMGKTHPVVWRSSLGNAHQTEETRPVEWRNTRSLGNANQMEKAHPVERKSSLGNVHQMEETHPVEEPSDPDEKKFPGVLNQIETRFFNDRKIPETIESGVNHIDFHQ